MKYFEKSKRNKGFFRWHDNLIARLSDPTKDLVEMAQVALEPEIRPHGMVRVFNSSGELQANINPITRKKISSSPEKC